MFLRNCWYVAGWGADFGRQLSARTILGDEIVIFRRTNGSAVALEDERLLVGAPEAGNDGLVLSYHYDTTAMTWVQNNNLDIPGQGFRQGYGVSVALSGGRAFTGMEFGALPAVLGVHGFVYDNSSKKWGHKHLYQPMSPVSRYGSVLAADGNTLAVGSPTETVNGSNAGVVYIHDIFF